MALEKQFYFVAAGEILIDFVSKEPCVPLKDSKCFGKFFGGAPANVAVNMNNLGIPSTIVSKVGDDGLGRFLIEYVEEIGIDSRYISRTKTFPTSMVVVTSKKTPAEFIAYRQADTQLIPSDISDEVLSGCKIFHTTAHGIARKPTQDAILDAFRRAVSLGKMTSFDPNYSVTFWPDRDEAMEVMKKFFKHTTFCKPSSDDCERIMGKASLDSYIDRFHEWGIKNVMLTCGAEGAIFSSATENIRKRYDSIHTPDLVDTTGAGDAFTAGFFSTYLKTQDFDAAMKAGIKTATFKIKHLGAIAPLPKVEEFW